MLKHTDGQAADQVDQQNQQTGDGVAADKFGGTVHGTEEVRLLRQFFTAFFGGGLIDHTGVQISVNRHLFTRHGIQGETRVHFGDATGTFGHHNEVDDHQNCKNDKANHVIASNHEFAKC